MEVPKEGVEDECQEEDSQMPAECQEKDSQMPAEKGNGSLRRCLHLLIPFTWAMVRAVLRLQTYLLIPEFLLALASLRFRAMVIGAVQQKARVRTVS